MGAPLRSGKDDYLIPVSERAMKERKKVLIVSDKKEDPLFRELFPNTFYLPYVCVQSMVDIKQRLLKEKFDLIWVQKTLPPLEIRDISSSYDIYTILLVRAAVYDQVAYQMRDSKVLVFVVPCPKATMLQVIALTEQFMNQTALLEAKIAKAQKRLNDLKTVDRCKMELMDHFHWNEQKAHRYVEKSAMDNGMTKVQVAGRLLAKLQLRKEQNI